MQVPAEIRKCVVFLAYNGTAGGRLAGTAFFVVVKSSEDVAFYYLITAKHVIAQIRSNSIDGHVLVRINNRSGGFSFVPVPCENWLCHPTDTVADVSVFPWFPDPNVFDFLAFPFDGFLTPSIISEQGVGVGDEVFMAGLFASHYGKQRNVPVIRIGNIACVPEEPVDTGMGPMDAYIIEARSIGGLSGSPVFVNLGAMRIGQGVTIGGGARLHLLGLVHGHWDVREGASDSLVLDDAVAHEAKVNMGMAIVAPFQKISEVLLQEKLETTRAAELKRILAERARAAPIASPTQ